MTLDDAIQSKNNNYNLIRLLAALMVVFAHSFGLFPNNGYSDPIGVLLKFGSGALAVSIFFFLSGIYIAKSCDCSETKFRFITMRVFRIWPALIVCTIITVFLIGPMVTILPTYFTLNSTWSYFFTNVTMAWKGAYHIPGVFTNNFFLKDHSAINGSLWTLPVEIRCYFLIFVISSVFNIFKRPYLMVLITIAFGTLSYHENYYLGKFLTSSDSYRPLMFFLSGTLCYMYRSHILIHYRMSIFFLVMALIFNFDILFYVALIYGMLTMGASKLLIKVKLPGDYSYGIYIYGFLIQQTVNFYIPGLNSYSSMLVTLPVTLIIGALSWHFIEHPSMQFANSFLKRRRQSSKEADYIKT